MKWLLQSVGIPTGFLFPETIAHNVTKNNSDLNSTTTILAGEKGKIYMQLHAI